MTQKMTAESDIPSYSTDSMANAQDGQFRPDTNPQLLGTSVSPVQTRGSTRDDLRATMSHVDGDGYYMPRASVDGQHLNHSHESNEKYLEITWDSEDDPMNPKNIKSFRKWVIVFILACGSLCVTCASSIYTTTYDQMDPEFGNSRIVATLGLTLFVFGLGLSPMVLGPLSEFYGRRPIYICAFIFFTIWTIPSAVAKNIQTMLVARFLAGLSGSAFLSVAGGTVGDMFNKEQLQAPMIIYTASPMLGPALGPIMGGFINFYTNWRWTYYVLIIWSTVMLASISILVPETYSPVVLRTKARLRRKETGDDRWKAKIEIMEKSVTRTVLKSLYRPFLLLFLDPMCFNLCLFTAILLGILYLFFGAFALVFRSVYGFNLWQIGLSFCGLLVGMFCAIASNRVWHKLYIYLLDRHERIHGERKSEPEYRLPPTIVGSWFCVVGLFGFGWTIYPSVHWIVPQVFSGIFGCGMVLVFTGVYTFLVEAFPLYAASALSANSFARSSFAGAFPLFGVQMYNKLNFHWATTLLAFLTLVMAPFPYIFFIYGKRLRQRSRFSPGP